MSITYSFKWEHIEKLHQTFDAFPLSWGRQLHRQAKKYAQFKSDGALIESITCIEGGVQGGYQEIEFLVIERAFYPVTRENKFWGIQLKGAF